MKFPNEFKEMQKMFLKNKDIFLETYKQNGRYVFQACSMLEPDKVYTICIPFFQLKHWERYSNNTNKSPFGVWVGVWVLASVHTTDFIYRLTQKNAEFFDLDVYVNEEIKK